MKTFQKTEAHIVSTIVDITEEVISTSVANVIEAYRHHDPTLPKDPFPITEF